MEHGTVLLRGNISAAFGVPYSYIAVSQLELRDVKDVDINLTYEGNSMVRFLVN